MSTIVLLDVFTLNCRVVLISAAHTVGATGPAYAIAASGTRTATPVAVLLMRGAGQRAFSVALVVAVRLTENVGGQAAPDSFEQFTVMLVAVCGNRQGRHRHRHTGTHGHADMRCSNRQARRQ